MLVKKLDKYQLVLLAICFKLFHLFIKGYYQQRKVWSPGSIPLSVVFFIRNGHNLIGRFSRVLRERGYPKANLNRAEMFEKLANGYSLSRFGDGEFAIIKADLGAAVYFDTATQQAKELLVKVLEEPLKSHIIGIIHEDVVASQLSFSNALSQFKSLRTIFSGPRMPVLSEYDDDMLEIYKGLCSHEEIYEAGLLRNSSHSEHRRLWENKQVLYITGSKDTSAKYGFTIEQLFVGAFSVEVIETVTEQALSTYYRSILELVLNCKDLNKKMIFISQGMAGAVLAYDLAKLGYHAIDFGQPFVNYK